MTSGRDASMRQGGTGGHRDPYLPGMGPSQPAHVVQLPQSSLHPVV